MFSDYSWLQPEPRNIFVDRRRLRIWRRYGRHYESTRQFELLKQIESRREKIALNLFPGNLDQFWLLPFRVRFRRVLAISNSTEIDREIDAIRYYMAYCPREMIPICVWLIGKFADRFRLYGIADFCRDPSPQIRKHTAKALRRLEAWWLLEDMATLYPQDATIQYFANSPVTHRPFAERLSNYVASVDDSHAGEVATPSRMPFWALENSWDYTPPKSVQLIRRMLRRIRHWVRWGVS